MASQQLKSLKIEISYCAETPQTSEPMCNFSACGPLSESQPESINEALVLNSPVNCVPRSRRGVRNRRMLLAGLHEIFCCSQIVKNSNIHPAAFEFSRIRRHSISSAEKGSGTNSAKHPLGHLAIGS